MTDAPTPAGRKQWHPAPLVGAVVVVAVIEVLVFVIRPITHTGDLASAYAMMSDFSEHNVTSVIQHGVVSGTLTLALGVGLGVAAARARDARWAPIGYAWLVVGVAPLLAFITLISMSFALGFAGEGGPAPDPLPEVAIALNSLVTFALTVALLSLPVLGLVAFARRRRLAPVGA